MTALYIKATAVIISTKIFLCDVPYSKKGQRRVKIHMLIFTVPIFSKRQCFGSVIKWPPDSGSVILL